MSGFCFAVILERYMTLEIDLEDIVLMRKNMTFICLFESIKNCNTDAIDDIPGFYILSIRFLQHISITTPFRAYNNVPGGK
jgi:predicted HAD superfamily hydrolase